MTTIGQGLEIMVIGLGITFSALAIFIGVMVILQRLFPAQEESEGEEPEVVKRPTVSTLARDTSEEEVVVAITLALAHLYSHELCRSNLGKSLETGPGPWWAAGQLEQPPLEGSN
jgi:Na+-transporting methylmalonyl-CoA/oxaloacetate decarboxylase gamma subunit